MFEHRGFVEAIKMVVPHYDPYKETEINKDAWIKIGNVMQNADTESKEVYYEAKYSLQGTTQGRYLTGGVPPVRFSM